MSRTQEARMAQWLKVALIGALTAVAITGLLIYFSPYQSCLRARAGDPVIAATESPATSDYVCRR